MKKKSPSQSAFFNPRAVIGLFVCLVGVLIAFFAFGASNAPSQPQGTAQQANQPQLDSGTMTREQLAGFYRSSSPADFVPPACVAGSEMFTDVPASNPFCSWIEELARRGITGGCTPTMYCPGAPVTRQEMAVFLIKTLEGAKPLFATVAPAGVSPVIVRGRGATGVERIAAGFFRVSFDRDVSGCTWLASYGPPAHNFVNSLWATVGGSGGPVPTPNQVGVVLRDDTGAQADGSGFHLEVVCP
jgi:S-layer homology domain